jgi:hypothetical protein
MAAILAMIAISNILATCDLTTRGLISFSSAWVRRWVESPGLRMVPSNPFGPRPLLNFEALITSSKFRMLNITKSHPCSCIQARSEGKLGFGVDLLDIISIKFLEVVCDCLFYFDLLADVSPIMTDFTAGLPDSTLSTLSAVASRSFHSNNTWFILLYLFQILEEQNIQINAVYSEEYLPWSLFSELLDAIRVLFGLSRGKF